jgi:hypothetical protein
LTAALNLDAIPLAGALTLVPGAAEGAGGSFSGNVTARVPAARVQDARAWTASGSIVAKRAQVYGLAVDNAGATVRLERGVLSARELRLQIGGAPVAGSGELHLSEPFRYQANLNLKDCDLAVGQQLMPRFRPPVPLAGKLGITAEVQGALSPLRLEASGTGTASELKVSDVQLRGLKFRWNGNTDRIRLADIRARLYGGDLTGSAQVPLQATIPGTLDLRFTGLDVGALAKDLSGLALRVEGQASGKVEGRLCVARPGQEREFTGSTELDSPSLQVQSIPTERLHGTIAYRNGTIAYRFDGDSLGGRFHIDGRYPPAKPDPSTSLPQGRRPGAGSATAPAVAGQPAPQPDGHLRVEEAQLPRIWDWLGAGVTLQPLRGALDLEIAYSHQGPERALVGDGRIVLRRLRWQTTDLADSIQGDAILTAEELRMHNLTGAVAGGLLDGQLAFPLLQAGRGRFSLSLNGAEAAQLLAPWPTFGSAVQGALDIRLRGTLGREWTGAGEIALPRGKVFGVDVASLRLPVDFAVVPSRGYGTVEVRDSSVQLALGRANFRATWSLGPNTRLQGRARFYNVDLGGLLRQAGDLGQAGSGHLTGWLDFSGSDVHSLNDVTATLNATLTEMQAGQSPVLAQILPFIPAGQGSKGSFRSGELRARLAGGLIRIERLTLIGTTVRLFIEGNMTLEGRLNLEVTAAAGLNVIDPATCRLLGLQLPSVGRIPGELIARASSALSTRVIHLRVAGTVRSPSIQIEPVPALTEDVLRFLLGPTAVPGRLE